MQEIEEIIPFLKLENSRLDLKAVSLTYVLGLTGTPEGINIIISNTELIKNLVLLTSDQESVSKDAALALVNLSADPVGAEALLQASPSNHNGNGLLQLCVKNILDENSSLADPFSMVLSNLTRPEKLVENVLNSLLAIDFKIEKFVACFTKISYNKKKQNLNYLGPIFSNLTQTSIGRHLICNKETRLFQRLLPFVHHEGSLIRRGGICGLVKNICFDSSLHCWLLSGDVDILPYILLPLAGPEEFDDETNDKFPAELQYLDADKKREEDPDILIILFESLNQLCATKNGRETLRNKGTYEILREFHKFECERLSRNHQVLLACENVVDILIRREDEIMEDNLKHLEIPEDVLPKIEKINENL